MKLALVLILFSFTMAFAKNNSSFELRDWILPAKSADVTSKSPLGSGLSGTLISKNHRLSFLAKDAAPYSITGAKALAKEMGSSLVKVIRKKDYVIFHIQGAPKQHHLVSTKGGYLQIIENFTKSDKLFSNFLKGIER